MQKFISESIIDRYIFFRKETLKVLKKPFFISSLCILAISKESSFFANSMFISVFLLLIYHILLLFLQKQVFHQIPFLLFFFHYCQVPPFYGDHLQEIIKLLPAIQDFQGALICLLLRLLLLRGIP